MQEKAPKIDSYEKKGNQVFRSMTPSSGLEAIKLVLKIKKNVAHVIEKKFLKGYAIWGYQTELNIALKIFLKERKLILQNSKGQDIQEIVFE
jgi:hypothetical protein